MVAYVEETIERDERVLDIINGREREDLHWRIRRWRREVEALMSVQRFDDSVER